MTSVQPPTVDGPRSGHTGDLRLRRFRAGELDGAAATAVQQHLDACGGCRARLGALADEARAFEHEIPFERFAGGVERARRVPRARPRRVWAVAVPALAAAGLLLILGPRQGTDGGHGTGSRIKGSATDATIRIGRADGSGQRAAGVGAVETLAPGDRIRIGYRTAEPRHLVAVSVDEAGEVTALYPERGRSVAVDSAAETTFLPDGLEFTGAGRERVFVFVSDRAMDVASVTAAVRAAHAAVKGDLAAMHPRLPATDAFSWTFQKP